MSIRHTASLLAVLATTFLSLAATVHGATLPAGFEDVEVVPNVKNGTSIAFAPDGSMFYNEGGDIRMWRPGVATPVNVGRVSGFILGMVTDAQFASNRYLFVNYMTNSSASTPGNGRVARFTIGANGVATPAAPTVLIGTVTGACPNPNTTDCIPNLKTSEHDLGSIVSDPRDGTLWITNGDNAAAGFVDPLSFNAQNPDSLQGKVLHVDRDGRGLPGHPFCPTVADLTRNCTKVHAVGLRNAYRMNLGPMGLPVAGDVGWNSREELNVYRAGKNYGWPCYEGSLRTPSWNTRSECAPLYGLEGTPEGGQRPAFEYDQTVGESIIGGPTITNPSWPAEMRGEVLFGDYVAGWIRRARFNAAGDLIAVNDFGSDWKKGVEMKFGPDGDLYYLLYSGTTGAIRRIHYTGSASANRAPEARASANVTGGRLPLQVRFSSAGSLDPDGDRLSYAWDFGDGTRSTEANPTHTYEVKRVVTATLTVSDGKGGSHSSSVRINAGDIPPRIRLTAPSRFRAGQRVTLRATATNPDGAAFRARNYSWAVRLRHQTHDHPLTDPTGRQRISFTPLIDHDADSYYIVSLTVTEASGAKSVKTVRIRPETSRLRIPSVPAGAPVTYAGSVFASPLNRLSAVGFRTTVSVPASFTVRGRIYVFDRWSNGRPRQQNLVIPARDLALTATYRGSDQSAGTRARTFTALRIAPATVRAGQQARIRYTTRRSGRVRFTFMRETKGYLLGGQCRATSVAPEGTERCALQVRSGVMTTRARAGRNTIGFRGRVAGRRLKPGRYVVVARLLDSRGRAIGERRVSLRVKR